MLIEAFLCIDFWTGFGGGEATHTSIEEQFPSREEFDDGGGEVDSTEWRLLTLK